MPERMREARAQGYEYIEQWIAGLHAIVLCFPIASACIVRPEGKKNTGSKSGLVNQDGVPVQSKQRNTTAEGVHGEAQVLAEEITRYIQESGFVADTMDGICSWWLVRERLREERQRVESALSILCQRGVIEQRQLADGTTLYLAAEKMKVNVKDRRGH